MGLLAWLILIFFLGLVIIISFRLTRWSIKLYNIFINKYQDIKTRWSNVLTEYKRRADILYNMSQVVKSYGHFENQTMSEVIKMRSNGISGNIPEQIEAVHKMDGSFSSALSRLMAIAEQYPQLKAVEEYDRLSKELRNTEDRINEARIAFNLTVREYNGMVLTFPNKILAKMFKFKEYGYYDYQQGEDEHKVSL